ncbi:MAG TPA: MFS transporter [Acidiferrobacteraceae bacterium]|nr:MFS transporter [Acidiferrobacteraceae bacterium]
MPYWRLSAFYLFYFATLGTLIPYWGPYLRSIGFSAIEIGNLVALILATKIVAPNVWGWIADRSGRCMGVVRLAALLTVVCYIGVFFGREFWWLALVMTLFSFFWNASLPQLEATTLNYVDGGNGHYGRVRLWGSIGFIVAVWSMGALVDVKGEAIILPVLLVLMIGIWLSSLLVPESACQMKHVPHAPLLRVFKSPAVVVFLLVSFLMQASHAPYYTFYTIYLSDYGYTKSLIGFLWAFGVVCEIGIFLVMHRMKLWVSLPYVILACFGVAIIRWILIAQFPAELWILVVAQAMHALTFGAFHASAVQLIHQYFIGPHQHRGQALYSSVSFGMGGAVGSFYSGYSWAWWGATTTFMLAALISAIALLLTYFYLCRGAGHPAIR